MPWHRLSAIAAVAFALLVAVLAWQLRQARTVQSAATRALAHMAARDLRDIPAYLDRVQSAPTGEALSLLDAVPAPARHAEDTLRIMGQHLERRRSQSWAAAATGVDSLVRSVVVTRQRLEYFGDLPDRDRRFLALLGPAVRDLQRVLERYPDPEVESGAVKQAGEALGALAQGWSQGGVLPDDRPPRGVGSDEAVRMVQQRFGVDPGLPHTVQAAEPNAWLGLWAWRVHTRDVAAMVHMANGRLIWWQEVAPPSPPPAGNPAVPDRAAALEVARRFLAAEGYRDLSAGEAVTGEDAVRFERPREAGNPSALPTLTPRANQWLVRFHRVADGVPVLADWTEVLVDSHTGRVTGFATLGWGTDLDLVPSLTRGDAVAALQEQGHGEAMAVDTLAVIRSPYSHQPVLAYRLVGPKMVAYVEAHKGKVELVVRDHAR